MSRLVTKKQDIAIPYPPQQIFAPGANQLFCCVFQLISIIPGIIFEFLPLFPSIFDAIFLSDQSDRPSNLKQFLCSHSNNIAYRTQFLTKIVPDLISGLFFRLFEPILPDRMLPKLFSSI